MGRIFQSCWLIQDSEVDGSLPVATLQWFSMCQFLFYTSRFGFDIWHAAWFSFPFIIFLEIKHSSPCHSPTKYKRKHYTLCIYFCILYFFQNLLALFVDFRSSKICFSTVLFMKEVARTYTRASPYWFIESPPRGLRADNMAQFLWLAAQMPLHHASLILWDC